MRKPHPGVSALPSNTSKRLIGINNHEISRSGRAVANEMEYAFWRPRVRGPTPTTTKLAKTMMPAARYNPHTMLKWYRMKTTSSAVAVISQLVRSNTTRLTYRGRSAITLRSDPAPGRWSRTSSSTRAGDTVLMAASIAANNPPKPINTIEPSSW